MILELWKYVVKYEERGVRQIKLSHKNHGVFGYMRIGLF